MHLVSAFTPSSVMRRAVAVKEIRINPEEGLPFTAIREGEPTESNPGFIC